MALGNPIAAQGDGKWLRGKDSQCVLGGVGTV